jgi:hypothetical protein
MQKEIGNIYNDLKTADAGSKFGAAIKAETDAIWADEKNWPRLTRGLLPECPAFTELRIKMRSRDDDLKGRARDIWMARAKLRRAKEAREAVNTERAQAIKDAHREPIYNTAKARAAGMLGLAIVSLAVTHVSRWVRDDRNKVRYPATFVHPPSGGPPSPSSKTSSPSPFTLPEGLWWEHRARCRRSTFSFYVCRRSTLPNARGPTRPFRRVKFSRNSIRHPLLFCTMRRRRAISN